MTATYAYNFVNMSNMTGIQSFLDIANASAGGFLFTMIDFLFFFVLFITLASQFGFTSGLLSSAFICLVLSILLFYMGLINFLVVGLFVGLILIMIAYIIWNNKYD